MPNEVANCRDDRRVWERKRVSQFSYQGVYGFPLVSVQHLTYCNWNGCIGVDARSIAIQGEEVCLFSRLRERCFCMNDIAPATFLTDLAGSFLTFLEADSIFALG